MIMNEMQGYPNMRWSCVDIKDVTKAHFRALERPEAANKRFILS
jgi:nucleoside-diphosphate-sugar epimerase